MCACVEMSVGGIALLTDAIQEGLHWASRIPGDGPPFNMAVFDVP